MDAGHSTTHLPQPTHNFSLIVAYIPLLTSIASFGQTLMQHPQETHNSSFTFDFFLTYLSVIIFFVFKIFFSIKLC